MIFNINEGGGHEMKDPHLQKKINFILYHGGAYIKMLYINFHENWTIN